MVLPQHNKSVLMAVIKVNDNSDPSKTTPIQLKDKTVGAYCLPEGHSLTL
jgi:hypothetical protein